MGIPSYFNFILQNHPKIICKIKNITCDYLFVDSNSLIYDSINELKGIVPDNLVVYKMVYQKVIDLIEVNKPKTQTFICFDGVPPLAKMHQQRQRRFKSIMTKKILEQDSSTTAEGKFNTNVITPGTDFMNKLDEFLTKQFKDNEFVSFDGSCNNGEGEHKICKYVRTMNIPKTKNIVIYGLDADLIMLGLILSCEEKRVFLYKETCYFDYISQIDKTEKYYFNMNRLSLELDNLLSNCNIKQSVYDYIFLCFLCGNDFMPHVPSINIRNNGIHYLIKTYKFHNKRNKSPMINIETQKINWEHVRHLFVHLSTNETAKMMENLQWKMKFKHKLKPMNMEDKLNFLPSFDTEVEELLIENPEKYNEIILKNSNIDALCFSYLKTLEWTWYYYCGFPEYYHDACYEHTHGPLFKDIINNIPLSNSETMCNIRNKASVNTNKDINRITQLFFVLPYENHKEIIPRRQYELCCEKVYHEFPLLRNTNFNVEYAFCKYFWEGHLSLDHIDFFEMNNLINSLI
jgi:5'-3' exonuclease